MTIRRLPAGALVAVVDVDEKVGAGAVLGFALGVTLAEATLGLTGLIVGDDAVVGETLAGAVPLQPPTVRAMAATR